MKDKCYYQNLNKYTSYCLDYKCHLCDEYLKSKEHINHIKSNMPEIQPIEDEINIIKKVLFFNHLPSISYWQPHII